MRQVTVKLLGVTECQQMGFNVQFEVLLELMGFLYDFKTQWAHIMTYIMFHISTFKIHLIAL